MQASAPKFNIVIIGQNNRLQYEALLFAASLRHSSPDFSGRLFVAVPQPGPRWPQDPTIQDEDLLKALRQLDAEILPFENKIFGASYPYGNKIEALLAMPEGEPFVFFDSDTLITGDLTSVPFDFDRPGASLRVEGTWPKPTLYGPGLDGIWKALYQRFGLDFDSSLDTSQPVDYWRRYLYFNAGYFFHSCPHTFGKRFLDYARTIRDGEIPEMAGQNFDPWLDQAALPLVIHSFGGGRDALPVKAITLSRCWKPWLRQTRSRRSSRGTTRSRSWCCSARVTKSGTCSTARTFPNASRLFATRYARMVFGCADRNVVCARPIA
jgi:hypothetical protein